MNSFQQTMVSVQDDPNLAERDGEVFDGVDVRSLEIDIVSDAFFFDVEDDNWRKPDFLVGNC